MDADRDFEAVDAQYRTRIVRHVAGIIGNAAQAEDLAQEALLRVHRALPALRAPAARTAWVFRIASNVAVDHLRTREARLAGVMRSVDGDRDDDDRGIDLPSGEPSAQARLEQREMAECLQEHVHRLSPPLREAIVLRDVEGLADRDIADALGVSPGAAKVRIHRARRALRSLLERTCTFHHDAAGTLQCVRAGDVG